MLALTDLLKGAMTPAPGGDVVDNKGVVRPNPSGYVAPGFVSTPQVTPALPTVEAPANLPPMPGETSDSDATIPPAPAPTDVPAPPPKPDAPTDLVTPTAPAPATADAPLAPDGQSQIAAPAIETPAPVPAQGDTSLTPEDQALQMGADVSADKPDPSAPLTPEDQALQMGTLVTPEAGNLGTTFAQQASAGSLSAPFTTAGLLMGGAIATAAMVPAAAPVAVAAGVITLGMIVGAAAGSMAGEQVSNTFRDWTGIPRIEDLPANLKAFGMGGDFLGSSLGVTAPTGFAGATGWRFASDRLGQYFNKLIDYAAERPAHFLGAEVGAAGAGSLAAIGAQDYKPGNKSVAAVAETAASIFSPLAFGARTAVSLAKGQLARFTEAGRNNAAYKILAEAIGLAKEDPILLEKLLRAAPLHPAIGDMTAADITGSKALAEIVSRLFHDFPLFEAEARAKAKAGLEAMQTMMELLTASGDPAATALIAQIRQTEIKAIIAAQLAGAREDSINAARRITSDSPAALAELSKEVVDRVMQAVKDGRAAERYLWGLINKDTKIPVTNILTSFKRIRGMVMSEYGMDLPKLDGKPILQRFEKDMEEKVKAGDNTPLTIETAMKLRSTLLDAARASKAREATGGSATDTKAFSIMAEAILEDMGHAQGKQKGLIDTARAFSREFHDNFTREFAGDTLAKDAKGSLRIPVEVMLQDALGSGGVGADLRIGQLFKATNFMAQKGWAEGMPEDIYGKINAIGPAVDRFIRLAASDSIMPSGDHAGHADAGKLARFIRTHSLVIDRFPGMREDLQAAVDSAEKLRDIEHLAWNQAPTAVKNDAAFSKITPYDSPAAAIATILTGKAPESDFNALAKMLKIHGGQEALNGLAAAAWQHVSAKAIENGKFSFAKAQAAFYEPAQPGVASLMDMLIKSGAISFEQATNYLRLFDAAARVGAGEVSNVRGPSGEIKGSFDPLVNTLVRMLGAEGGGAVAKHLFGKSTLIANSAGATYLAGVFANMNPESIQLVLMRLVKDRQLLADAISKSQSQAQSMAKAIRLHSALLTAGLIPVKDSPAPTQDHLDKTP